MAQQRLAMRKIKEILRLHLRGGVASTRRIGLAVGCGKSAVAECLRRGRQALVLLPEIALTAGFLGRLGRLPDSVRQQASHAYALWRADPHHPSLQFKRVSQS